MAKFNPAIQIKKLKEIENDVIKNFTFNRKYNSTLIFNFYLTNILLNLNDISIEKDFSKYKIKIEYSHKKGPKIFIAEPTIENNAPHRFSDNSLCLFKNSNFTWKNGNSIATEIIPLIIMWIYFYEIWLITGIWEGKEAKH